MIHNILVEEAEQSEDESVSPNPTTSVFDWLQSSTSKKCMSVFTYTGKEKDRKISVVNRIKDGPKPKRSIFAIIKTSEMSSSSWLQQVKSSAFSGLGVINEVHSSIPSQMKGFSSLDVKTDGSLRVKRRTVIFMGQQNNSNSSNEAEEEEVVHSNHITAMNVMTQTQR